MILDLHEQFYLQSANMFFCASLMWKCSEIFKLFEMKTTFMWRLSLIDDVRIGKDIRDSSDLGFFFLFLVWRWFSSCLTYMRVLCVRKKSQNWCVHICLSLLRTHVITPTLIFKLDPGNTPGCCCSSSCLIRRRPSGINAADRSTPDVGPQRNRADRAPPLIPR